MFYIGIKKAQNKLLEALTMSNNIENFTINPLAEDEALFNIAECEIDLIDEEAEEDIVMEEILGIAGIEPEPWENQNNG